MARRTAAAARMEEVTDLEAEPVQASGLTLEAGLIFTTFLALLVGMILAQICLKEYFGKGLLS